MLFHVGFVQRILIPPGKACLTIPFFVGLCQVFGSALIAGWCGLAAHGGYLGMFDWATVWPVFTVIMKYLGYMMRATNWPTRPARKPKVTALASPKP